MVVQPNNDSTENLKGLGSFEIFKLACIQVAWANASIMTAPAVKTGVMKSQSKLFTFTLHFYTLWVWHA